jgi:autotransporter passenger strand-loop-strand repeat protein
MNAARQERRQRASETQWYLYGNGATALNGGYDLVGSGGTASATTVNGGSEYVLAGGSASSTTVSSGLEVVFGTVTAVVLGSGASEFVSSGATARGTTISSGGTDYVMAGGTASGTKLAGGIEIVYGTATSGTITSGTQDVEGGGSAAATALTGGFEDILAGGLATGTTIGGTGYEFVFSGGTASGTVLSGGTLEVASGGASGNVAVTFFGGGTLQLDDSVHFGGLVAGFGIPDQLDLADVPFIARTRFTFSGGTASGTLTVTDGTSATTANITLLGNYTAGQFHITSAPDGQGGTLVTDPPIAMTDPGPIALVTAHQT